jgi:Soluble lytic murein transglycosylase and related regulatory proteins (some contain LysM/invasin domains)
MKKYLSFLIAITATAALMTISADASADVPVKKHGRRTSQEIIQDLTMRLDSLQKAYDTLYVEYQTILEPITSDDDVDEDDYMNFVAGTDYNPESMDSLLNIYYLQKNNEYDDMDAEVVDRDILTSSIPDSVYIARLKKMDSFIPLTFNQHVKNGIILYTEKKPSMTQKIVSLGTYYLPIIEEILDEYGLPKELKAMAVIESAFNPLAVSRARAKGMWQFMYNTARQYGLNITSFVDERLDPVASCRAAAQYLRDSYMIFGDWSLAIASYNCGAGNVLKAIRRSGGKTDFWEIYDYLPRETRGYVPIFMAALYTLQYYPEHGISLKPISLPAHVDTFHINRMLHFKQISDNIGISMDDLRDVNPQYFHDIIPGDEREYILRLPHNYSMQFVDKEQEIYNYQDSTLFNEVTIKKIKETSGTGEQRVYHKVKKGETLSSIAVKYHTTVANVKKWNGIKGNTIQIGQRLSIYGRGGSSSSASSTSASSSSSKPSTSASSTSSGGSAGFIMYTIKKGDTLYSIANKYPGVSLNDILKLNNMNMKSKIYPGMRIRIKKAE